MHNKTINKKCKICKICKIDNNVEISYIDEGKGVPIVLIHGFPQFSFLWRNIISELRKDFRVIAPDLRGMGSSSLCHFGQDKKTLANDIIQLLNSLKINN